MTQQQLAERAGVSVELISKLEQGVKQTATLLSLHKIAHGLDVEIATLFTRPAPILTEGGEEDGGIVAIRRAILAITDDGQPSPLEELRRQADYAWRAFVRSKYDVLGRVLPDLITDARATMRDTPTPEVYAVTSDIYHTAATTLTLLGYTDLAYIAMERVIRAAERTSDQARHTIAVGRMSWVLLHQTGGADLAMRLATDQAARAEPRLDRAAPVEIAAWGGLLIDGAVAAARADRADDAEELLRLAEAAAARVQDTSYPRLYGRPFGAAMVTMQQVDVAVVGDRPGRALDIARRMPPEPDLPLDWRARHLADVASAQTSLGRDADATETLLRIEQMSPEWLRYQTYPRTIVRELLERERRARTPLRQLAARLEVA